MALFDAKETQQLSYEMDFDSGDAENANKSASNSNTVMDLIQSSSHPQVAFFHMIFKVLAVLIYVMGSTFVSNFSSWFIPCVLFIAADFWVTKNVSGRLMVGLRWWSEIGENGENIWRFENRSTPASNETSGFIPTGGNVNDNDYRIFWYSMYLNGAAWGFLFIWNFMRLKITSLMVISIAVSMQWSNIVGYWKCHKDMENKLESNLNSFITSNAFSFLRGGIFGSSGNTSQT